ncbi:hypothetical protein IG193_05400 [Infirmifilum lucidum]|uniref:Restriction endonuclease type IV Mrr domain-containing protein n=1 Tax=Infirmifilum lucidum TaxID=2776706 RepID=A0A7L9FF07_9CREN|nr:hypothetical protein [Infirmifilum lucidum]QOJ78211.1 hypothetical protein IG193_05400 [Infirmifilum lucidum]
MSIAEVERETGINRIFVEELLRSLNIAVEDGVIRERLSGVLLKAWLAGHDIVSLALNSGWSSLEELVSHVLSESGYRTYRTVRFRFQGRRFEVDVLAFKTGLALCIDCKRWKRLREGMLRRAAEAQHARCGILSKALEAGLLIYDVPAGEYKMLPLIVSLYEPSTVIHSNTIITGLRGLVELTSEDTVYMLASASIQPVSFTVPRRIRLF